MERGVRSQPPLALLLTSLPSLPESRATGSPDSQVLLAQATQAPHCPGSSYSPISPGSTSSPLSQALQSPSPGVEGSSDFHPSPKSTGLPLFTGYPLLYRRPWLPSLFRVCLLSYPPSLPRLTTLPLPQRKAPLGPQVLLAFQAPALQTPHAPLVPKPTKALLALFAPKTSLTLQANQVPQAPYALSLIRPTILTRLPSLPRVTFFPTRVFFPFETFEFGQKWKKCPKFTKCTHGKKREIFPAKKYLPVTYFDTKLTVKL